MYHKKMKTLNELFYGILMVNIPKKESDSIVKNGFKKYTFIFLLLSTISLVVNGCADTSIVNPPPESDPFFIYRWLAIGGAIIAFIFQFGIISTINEQAAEKVAESVGQSLIGIPLQWTILGEWIFSIWEWLANLWNPIVALLCFLMGAGGSIASILVLTVLFGFVFPSPDLFYLSIVPMFLGVIIHLVQLVSIAGKAKG